MTKKKQTLTASQIKYLITIYHLDISNTGTRCVDIAKNLGISKPSVHTMLQTLCAMKLIKKTKVGSVFLMEEGKTTASQYSQYYQIVCHHFEKYFLLPHNVAKRTAFTVISSLSTDNIEIMCNQMNNMGEGVNGVTNIAMSQ